jgi:hypothetical protein
MIGGDELSNWILNWIKPILIVLELAVLKIETSLVLELA